jgi:CBS domain-containing protein
VLDSGDTRAVAEFLGSHPPFDALDHASVQRVAASVEIEKLRAGTTVFGPGDGPVTHLRVVRQGEVELRADNRVLDLLGEGELFGHASMLSGLPANFEARAVGDTLCYRIPVEVAEPALAVPAGLRYVARSLAVAPGGLPSLVRAPTMVLDDQPVRGLLSGDPVICGPETPIRAAAERMSAAHVTSVVVQLAGGGLGIMTDHDLRTRVVAEGLSGDAPVCEAMSAPAYTCAPERTAGEVLIEMAERGFRHLPVISATGAVLGVIEDTDLLIARARSSLYLRQRIAAARATDELAAVAAELGPMVIALHEGGVGAANLMAVYAAAVDAVTRRLLELELARRAAPEHAFAWLSLGSQARRESLPASDVDSAVVWFGPDHATALKAQLVDLARAVSDGLGACGLRVDEHGANAAEPSFVRSLASWRALIAGWIEDPTQDKALILTSVLVDSRPVWGVHTGTPVADTFRLASHAPALLRLLARFALSHRPPTGFLRGLVVEHGGEHRGRLDLKHGGALPIVDLARWSAMAAGVSIASTPERLRAAEGGGSLSTADLRTLGDAFALISELRVGHQVAQLRAGSAPDDHLDPAELSPLMRTQLKEAFRAVAAVQKRLGSELSLGVQ